MDNRIQELGDLQGDLTAAVAGDRDATARLLVSHGNRLARRIQHRLALNPYATFSAEDVLQEVFIDAFLGIASFDSDKGSLATWLDTLTDNRMISMLRERSRQKRGGNKRHVTGNDAWRSSAAELAAFLFDYREHSPSEVVNNREVTNAIRAGVATLPDDQRQAVELRYIQRRSLESTAAAMHKTDGAVRGLLHRAKRALRDVLGNSSRWFLRK